MKMKTLSKLIFASSFILWGLNTANAQSSLQDDQAIKAGEVKNIVDGQRYILKVEHVRPVTGKGYQLKILPDTVTGYLPDLDRTRLHPADTVSTSSTQFICTNFGRDVNKDNNGNWIVTIRPKQTDVSGIRQLKLSINQLGYTTLSINTAKGPVTYYGYIKQVAY